MTNLVNKPEEVIFRQTLNVTWKRWQIPKRLTLIEEFDVGLGETVRKEIWRKITNIDSLITPIHGIGLALWQLQKKMAAIRDEHQRYVWKTAISPRKRVTISKHTYSIWTLTCTRIKRDMSGVM
ncbi:hypothetical protein LCGC14_1717930 [marine sediment metagenome]|uniref:Uncharacterized protein n=1 Tax=marine sediment metagenome TaxID=412755 RepID=A0A0F9HD21_9ZZZZ